MSQNKANRFGSLAALGGGALWGIVDAGRVAFGDRILMEGTDTGLLVVLGALSGMAVALPAALAFPIWSRIARTNRAALLAGLALPTIGALGEIWFTDPPPFQEPFFTQGNPLAFAGVVAGVLTVCFGLYRVPAQILYPLMGISLATGLLVGHHRMPAATGKVKSGKPNILVVTLDTSRADHFGAYGAPSGRTEVFDKLAREGALFLNASAVAPVTGPSHTSMFSGSGPWDHGVLLNGVPIPDDRKMLAEVMHEHGYSTGAFVSAYVLDSKLGFDRGFEVYDDDFGWIKGSSRVLLARLWGMASRHADPDEVLERRAGDTVELASEWIDQQSGVWFAWVHLFDAHGPYTPPPPFDTRYYEGDPRDPANTSMQQVQDVAGYLKPSLAGITDLNYVLASYSGEISYADSQLGRLLERVDLENTLVVVIGDHGESLGEHGVWFNHGDDLYETSVHVPFVMHWPGHIQAGTRVQDPFDGADLSPTILSLIDYEIPDSMTGIPATDPLNGLKSKRTQAESLCFDRKANQQERAAGRITQPKYRMVSLRSQSSRYIQEELSGKAEYFMLSEDPKGLTDRAPEYAQTAEGTELMSYLRGQSDKLLGSDATSRSAVDMSEEERARLEALGYLTP